MLSLRRETDYAIHLLKYLSKNSAAVVSLKELSRATGISFLFLQKIARKLRIAGLIEAEKGIVGGYRLSMPQNQITLKKIIIAMEGSHHILPCYCEGKKIRCVGSDKKCRLKHKMTKLNKRISDAFEKMKLKDL